MPTSPLRCGSVSRPAHVRKGQSMSRDSPPWHGQETVPQHRWISHAGSAEPFKVARP